ncbi:YqcI/YcgG family protein [Paenibacillus urinalis]|uniref:YqcI/YcgG family protein n=1 Tax=Paenibacillus urinalis TaxID=521520 RepID=A0AAX3MS00_9BACL|nr:YqcI/YcgG family protein [Paenibacillus urinalis]WDH80391.1 YqcI/YcgG family protein [Paenibacillus urinalis]
MLMFDKENLEHASPGGWMEEAYRFFSAKMSDTDHKFPCIPATIGYKLNHFRYVFLSDPRTPQASEQLAKSLAAYGDQSKEIGSYTSLIAIFETPADLVEQYHVEDYQGLFWDVLSKTSAQDEQPWPEHIPQDPDHNVWEYCYGDEQYFMYCATPAHQRRQSRHFPYFIFAITPRWVLTEFNKNMSAAAQIKKKIRERITEYDETGVHPDLNFYGSEDNFEWKQYFLSDDEQPAAGKCPFAHLHMKKI